MIFIYWGMSNCSSCEDGYHLAKVEYMKEHCIITSFTKLKLCHVTSMLWNATPNKIVNLCNVTCIFNKGKGPSLICILIA